MKLRFSLILAAAAIFVSSPQALADQQTEQLERPVTVETLAGPVQIFDVALGKVVATLPNTKEMQDQAKTWIGSITGLSPSIKAEPRDGLVIRIPLQQAEPVQSGISGDKVQELFLFASSTHPRPFQMLMFTQKGQPLFVLTEAELTPFLHKFDLDSYFKNAQNQK